MAMVSKQNGKKFYCINTHAKTKSEIELQLITLVTRIDNPWLLLATLPLYHPVQDLKMTPLLQFTPVQCDPFI